MLSKTARLQEYVVQEITSGHLPPGHLIMSRHQLAQKFQCSRTVVERAIGALVKAGYLTSRQGSGTYVAEAEPQRKLRLLRLVSNRYAASVDQFSPLLSPGDEADLPIVLYSKERAQMMPEALASPDGAVIWDAPAPGFLSILEHLKRLGVPQLLLNRSYTGFDSVCTDVKASIREGLAWLLIEAGRDIAFVSYQPSSLRPYLADRIIAFFAAAIELGAHISPDHCILETRGDHLRQIADIALRLFGNADKCPRGLFVMDCDLVLPLVVAAQSYGLQAGRDFKLLTFDEIPALKGYRGIGMMRQRFTLFGKEIHRWITQVAGAEKKTFEALIKTELLTVQ